MISNKCFEKRWALIGLSFGQGIGTDIRTYGRTKLAKPYLQIYLSITYDRNSPLNEYRSSEHLFTFQWTISSGGAQFADGGISAPHSPYSGCIEEHQALSQPVINYLDNIRTFKFIVRLPHPCVV